MSGKALSKVMRRLEEAKAYIEGEREGYKVTVPLEALRSSSATGETVEVQVRQ